MERTRDRYLIHSIVHASKLLDAFQTPGEALRLTDLIERTGFTKATAFRLLYTLEKCGMVERSGEHQYRSNLRCAQRRKYRIGYAAQEHDYLFWRDVSISVARAAEAEGIELIVADNLNGSKAALRNADFFVRERVNLAMEFQADELIAPIISAKYQEAGIPLIAIEIPHPGSTYFGANNYEAGLMGGRYLARWAKQHWGGEVEEVVFLELPRAGSLPRSRLTGMLVGMKEVLREFDNVSVFYINGDGRFGPSLEAVRKHLRERETKKTLVGAINDPSALGALRAFEECGRAWSCAVMSQNASPEGRRELRAPHTRLIGSVAYFAERYGEGLIRLAMSILGHKPVPPAVFVKHQVITPENVNHYYPNDELTAGMAG